MILATSLTKFYSCGQREYLQRGKLVTYLYRLKVLDLALDGMNVGSCRQFTLNLLFSRLLIADESNDGVVRVSR